MAFNIVLIEPEIPNNTGNIGRLSLATGSHLHLVKPFGFEITDAKLKRAGLDYWQHIKLSVYENSTDFFEQHGHKNLALLSSHGTKSYLDIPYHKKETFFIFGKESVGLSKEITEKHKEHLYKIPLFSPHIRSLNLANAVSIITYEGLRQMGNQ